MGITKNENGYTAIELVLLGVIIILIIGIAWYVRESSLSTVNTYNAASNSSSVSPVIRKKTPTPATTPTSTTTTTKSTTTPATTSTTTPIK